MTVVRSRFGCSWQRNASVLVWTPVLLIGPALDLHGSAGEIVFQVAMILVIAASAVRPESIASLIRRPQPSS